MKAKELRVGNCLQRSDGSVITVKRLIQNDIDILVNETSGLFTLGYTALPIPLTEEILLKCPEITKCTYHEETWRIRDPKSQFHIVKRNDRFVFRGVSMSVIYVDTLHHLQNLVYVNTLKELEFKI